MCVCVFVWVEHTMVYNYEQQTPKKSATLENGIQNYKTKPTDISSVLVGIIAWICNWIGKILNIDETIILLWLLACSMIKLLMYWLLCIELNSLC